MLKTTPILLALGCIALAACASNGGKEADTSQATEPVVEVAAPIFDADSAYCYVARQVAFGPRVPNSDAHAAAGAWLASELERHGAEVTVQKADLTAFDGTLLHASNIIGRFNPEAPDRLLLLAHWDSRPWADMDADSEAHTTPVDGANDGASGVGVLLEIARILGQNPTDKGVDILFVDAEDWGDYENEDSWAMGTRYFANHPFVEGYKPSAAILLDMVGGRNARFYHEYISSTEAAPLVSLVWETAAKAGYSDRFINAIGSAVTDDHIELLKVGIPAINIIEYDPSNGFPPTWHTRQDTMEHIDKSTLKAVGQTLSALLYASASR